MGDIADGEDEMMPFKIVDSARERRFGIVAASLEDLINRARDKLGLEGELKVVLELDGTEVDEEEYFSTLEKNTALMILPVDEQWEPAGRISFVNRRGEDQIDGGRGLKSLLARLQNDIGHVSLLGGCELELLSDMDPDSLTDIVPDRAFLEQLKEASARFLHDRRQAQEAIELLKLYRSSDKDSLKRPAPST